MERQKERLARTARIIMEFPAGMSISDPGVGF
jgi:hypothetical protein